ncbi:hypothetical protein EJ08DRAFT_645644 [Tothia fuscella]|uniref:Uncharacterized protein n=1 Tax=Tothia fuscella TaxID=1048955 RepID=A0A9P4NZE7_9PEZI|nr:hypothetical protein EJ08DRAFT_645644 [Tothia fuscella]
MKTKRIFTKSAAPNRPKRGAGQDGSLVLEEFYVYFASSLSSWTNDELDGYRSHMNLRFLKYAIENRILITVYPPYSTYSLQPLDLQMATGGLVKILKREFYSLFKRAFDLQLFDPQVVLSRIRTTVKRPSTGTSKSSVSSIFNPQNTQKLRQLIKRVNNSQPSRDVQILSDAFITLATNNACLTTKVEGLTRAGILVLPTLLLQPNKERITNAKKIAQEEEKIRKAEEKPTPKPKRQARPNKVTKQVVVVVESDIEYKQEVQERIWSPQLKRNRRLPQYLKDYDLL